MPEVTKKDLQSLQGHCNKQIADFNKQIADLNKQIADVKKQVETAKSAVKAAEGNMESLAVQVKNFEDGLTRSMNIGYAELKKSILALSQQVEART